ncbi:MAG: sulfatase [Phycisphaeraceae bacterium]|nr:sulfatase [Phycisphaeraceae bacterium]
MLWLIFLLGLLGAHASAQDRPNIIYIFADDHARRAISAYDPELIATPNIDRLAHEGMLFTRSYCANSICGPSRATVLTGQHSHINGFTGNGSEFDPKRTTFPRLLHDSGYQTAIIGKWHLGSTPQGFDHWEILPGQGSYFNPDFDTADGRVRHEGYCTDIITDLSINWLEKARNEGRPFLLMTQHKAPHRNWMSAPRHHRLLADTDIPEPPTLLDDYAGRTRWLSRNAQSIDGDMAWQHDMKLPGENPYPEVFKGWNNAEWGRMTPAQLAAWHEAFDTENEAFMRALGSGAMSDRDRLAWMYQRYMKEYLRCVVAVDENVGRLLDYLDRTGLAENTIVVYSSDQGFYLGEHGWFDKRWMFEESLFMPLLVRWPGVVPPGSVCEALVQNIDHAPTLLDAAGVAVPAEMQGVSLLPLLRAGHGPERWRDAIYYAYYMYPSVHHVPIHSGVRTDRYKLIWFPQTREWQLFDLESDPHEMRSVHDDPAYAHVLDEMKSRYLALRDLYDVDDQPIIDAVLEAAGK